MKLCNMTDVPYFPTLRLFINNNFYEYEGERELPDLLNYVTNRSSLLRNESVPSIGYDRFTNKYVLIDIKKQNEKQTLDSIDNKFLKNLYSNLGLLIPIVILSLISLSFCITFSCLYYHSGNQTESKGVEPYNSNPLEDKSILNKPDYDEDNEKNIELIIKHN